MVADNEVIKDVSVANNFVTNDCRRHSVSSNQASVSIQEALSLLLKVACEVVVTFDAWRQMEISVFL